MKLDLDKMINELIKADLFDEKDRDVARVCLACLLMGANQRKVKKVANCDKFAEYWENLEKNHYFAKNQKIAIDKLDTDLPFVLMICCAKGHLQRKWKEG